MVEGSSGWDLEEVADYMRRGIEELRVRHPFECVHIIAHSMGGLVARRALGFLDEQSEPPRVATLLTLATPFGGQASAALGVERAPSVVPSWRNLAPDSSFLRNLYRVPLPKVTRHVLVFTYRDDVVPLDSQLRLQSQREAVQLRGLPLEHDEVLRSSMTEEIVRAAVQPCVSETSTTPPGAIAAP
jgi:pimeloyl-ACP methyl ester carboxylesterase